jgi:hypothetical protein
VGFEGLAPSLQCHPKDRHVLAAAVVGAVDVLVTNNLKDFPAKACEGYDLRTLDADPFLLSLLALDAAGTRQAILREASRLRAPAMTVRQLLASLTKVAPTYAHTVYNVRDELEEPTSDVPAYVVAEEDESPLGEYGRKPDLTNPFHVAFAWSSALDERDRYLDVLHALTWSPPAFGGYQWADEVMAGRGFASKVYEAVDEPTGAVAFIRLVPEVAQTSRAFAPFSVSGARFMTMKKRPQDGTWCVCVCGGSVTGWSPQSQYWRGKGRPCFGSRGMGVPGSPSGAALPSVPPRGRLIGRTRRRPPATDDFCAATKSQCYQPRRAARQHQGKRASMATFTIIGYGDRAGQKATAQVVRHA